VRIIPGTKQSVASVVDISRWKETEEELRAAYEQLSAQEEALRQQFDQMRQPPQDS
jgi:cell division protein FtsB